MNLQGLDHIALSVRDVEHSVGWYVEVLGLEQQHEAMWDGVPKFVGKGATGIAFFPAEGKENSLGRAERSRMLHFGKTSSGRNANWRTAESSSISTITESRTRFISAIPTGTRSRLPPTSCNNVEQGQRRWKARCRPVLWLRRPAPRPSRRGRARPDVVQRPGYIRRCGRSSSCIFFRCRRDMDHCGRLSASRGALA